MRTFSEMVQATMESLPKEGHIPSSVIARHVRNHLKNDGIKNPPKKLIAPVLETVIDEVRIRNLEAQK